MSNFPYIPQRQSVAEINRIDKQSRMRHSGTSSGEDMEAFKNHDACWIRLAGQAGMWPGVIVATIVDDSVSHPLFIIRLDNFTWPYYEVRDASLMGKSADALIPMQSVTFHPNWVPPSQ